MKIVTVRSATTHTDLSGERFSKAQLYEFLHQQDGLLMPVFNQHDHALPPIGRQIESAVVVMEDGEYALTGTWQIWEPGDASPGPDEQGRKIGIRAYPAGVLEISVDASLQGREFLDDLAALERVGFRIRVDRRKALDPGSILLIGLGAFGKGFLQEMGKDAWVAFREWLKRLRKTNPEKAKRVLFSVTVRGETETEVNIVLDDPTPETIDKLFEKGFALIQSEIDKLPTEVISRATFRGDQETYPLEYTVDRDGYPSRIDAIDLSTFGGVSIGVSGTPARQEQPQQAETAEETKIKREGRIDGRPG